MTLADRMAIKRVSDPRIFKNPRNAELWYKSVGMGAIGGRGSRKT